jgi:RimJ/RimL family protein N-acetyltransferase
VDSDPDDSGVKPGQTNLGYNVFPQYRGMGYATRGLALMLRWLRSTASFDTAILQIHRRNLASIRVAQKAGFVLTGETEDEYVFSFDIR